MKSAIIIFVILITGCSSESVSLRMLAMPSSPGHAKIIGRVLDDATLEQIPLVVVDLNEGEMISHSDGNGYFMFEELPPATYSVHLRSIGYRDTTLINVGASADSIRTLLVLMCGQFHGE